MKVVNSRIDFSRLPFPSDRLTLGQIRKINPWSPHFAEGAAPDLESFHRAEQGPVFKMLWSERMLAREAFDRAIAGKQAVKDFKQNDWQRKRITQLAEEYKSYGLAEGRLETEQLVRQIQAKAGEQAQIGRDSHGR